MKMFGVKIAFLLGLTVIIASAMPADEAKRGLVGGVAQLTGADLQEAEKELQHSLTKLAAGEGPVYTIGKVHSATRQVVSGLLYNFSADLIDNNNKSKKCHIKIWSQPWLENGIEVTFECEGEQKLVKKHSY